MNIKLNQILHLLKVELRTLLSISFGIFLFILFFQPFPLNKLELNNMLIFNAGLGGIVFLFMVLIRIIFYPYIKNYQQTNQEANLPYIIGGLIMIILSSTALAFYLRYVGMVEISFYLMFKVVIICLAPPVILVISDSFKVLEEQNLLLIQEKRALLKQITKTENEYLSKSIELVSEYKSENLTLPIAEIAIVKSADNYVEIIYKEGIEFKKKLIRNTLKNVEQQIKVYSNFVRCHRICIVNIHYVEKLNKSLNNYFLSLKEYPEQIPVSRQYLLKIKESI